MSEKRCAFVDFVDPFDAIAAYYKHPPPLVSNKLAC